MLNKCGHTGTLSTLQEEYQSLLEKFDKCAEANEKLFENNKSLKKKSQQFEHENDDFRMKCKRLQEKHENLLIQRKEDLINIKELKECKINYDKSLVTIQELKNTIKGQFVEERTHQPIYRC